jgi:hypothetical protein
MTLIDVSFSHCATGFATLADQNLNYTFTRPNVAYCDVGLYFRNGGTVTTDLLGGHSCGIAIKIDTGGINAGVFNFVGTRIEARTYKGRRTRLISVSGETNVKFSSLVTTCMGIAGDHLVDEPDAGDIDYLFKVSGGAQVFVDSSLISGPIASLSDRSWMQFTNCRFRFLADPRKDIKADENSGFEITNSFVTIDRLENKKYKTGRTIFLRKYVDEIKLPSE